MEILSGLPDISLTWILTAVALVLAYFYLTWSHGTWAKQGVKGDRPLPLFGTFLSTARAGGFAQYDTRQMEKYGKISGAYRGKTPVLEVADPEFLRLSFIKEFNSMPNRNAVNFGTYFDNFMTALTDDRWRHVRSSMTPTFTSGKLKGMMGRVHDCTQLFVKYLKQEEGKPFESKKRIGALTMDMISNTAFGVQVDSQSNPDHPMMENANRMMSVNQKGALVKLRKFFRIVVFMLFPLLIVKLLTKFTNLMFDNDAVDYFRGITERIVKDRGEDGSKQKDFVQLCLDKLIDDPKPGHPDTKIDKYGQPWSPKGLSKDEIIANAILFYLAGFETTASTLNWLFYELAMNPEQQQKCYEEICSVMEGKGIDECPTYEDITKLEFLEQCMEESMRLYPPAPRLERLVEQDCEVGGISLKKGTYVSAMIYGMHHDAEIWPDPETFDPDRFTAENKEGRHQCAWAPFGIGNRNCVGMRLALLEMKVTLVSVLRNFVLQPCADTPPRPVKLAKNFRMDPEVPIKLKAILRKQ